MFGIDTIEEASSLTEEPLKIAIIGPPGIGKSWLAATAPKPVFDIDFDGRKSSLAGKDGVTVKSYIDIDPNNPKAAAMLEADLNVIEYEKTMGRPIPATFVLDSLTYMRKATEAEIIRQQSTLSRPIRVGATSLKIGQGWDIVNGNRAYIEYIIGRLAVLGNLIVICHEQDEKDKKKSTATEKKYTGKTTIQPEYLNTILSLFNDVWLMGNTWDGKRVIKTGIDDEFVGKNTLGLPLVVENPDISVLLAQHRERLAVAKK